MRFRRKSQPVADPIPYWSANEWQMTRFEHALSLAGGRHAKVQQREETTRLAAVARDAIVRALACPDCTATQRVGLAKSLIGIEDVLAALANVAIDTPVPS